MRTLTVTETNDLSLAGRNLALTEGAAGVGMVVRHCAQTILGEMVFAKLQGMPYFETIWVGAPTTAPFEAAFRDRISAVTGVTGVEELTASQVGDAVRYSATISTVYGAVTVNG